MKTITQLLKTGFILILVISIVAARPASVKPNFNGLWKLDTAKSDFGGLPKDRAAATMIRLVQSKESIAFERTFQNIPFSFKETLSLDGKDIEIKEDESTIQRSMGISTDLQILTVNSKYHMTPEGKEPWDYIRTETYVLAKDGKSMLLTRISTLPDGKQEVVKAHYDNVK